MLWLLHDMEAFWERTNPSNHCRHFPSYQHVHLTWCACKINLKMDTSYIQSWPAELQLLQIPETIRYFMLKKIYSLIKKAVAYSHGLFLHNQNHIWFRLFFFHWQEAAWCTKSNEIAKHPFSYQHYAAVIATLCIFEKRNCCNLTCLVFSADSLNSHWVTYFFILENKWLPKTGLSQYHIFTPHLSCTKQFMIPISIEKSGYQSLGVRSS